MKANEISNLILIKNSLLKNQANRIKLLEDKMTEMRKKYFQLKYADMPGLFRENLLALDNY